MVGTFGEVMRAVGAEQAALRAGRVMATLKACFMVTDTTVLETVLGRNPGSTSLMLRHQFPAHEKLLGSRDINIRVRFPTRE
jgi:hypothetical protein